MEGLYPNNKMSLQSSYLSDKLGNLMSTLSNTLKGVPIEPQAIEKFQNESRKAIDEMASKIKAAAPTLVKSKLVSVQYVLQTDGYLYHSLLYSIGTGSIR